MKKVRENHTEEDLELLKKWLGRFRNSEKAYQEFFNEGKDNYLLYKCQKDKEAAGTDSYHHNIFVPYSFAFLEDFVAYMMLSLMTSPKVFGFSPRGSGSRPGPGSKGVSKELCLDLEQVVNYVVEKEDMEFYLELEEALKGCNIFSIGYLVVFPELGMNNFLDYVHLTAPYPLDIFPEPDAKRLSRAEWVIRRSHENFHVLKEREYEGIYKNVDDAKGFIGENTEVDKLLGEIGLSKSSINSDVKDGRVELLDAFIDNNIVTIGNKKAIIRNTFEDELDPSLFKFPILDVRTTGAPGEYFGVSLMQSIKPIQKELNLLRSQRRDNVSLLLNKLFIIDMMAGEVDLTTLFSAPGNAIMTSNRAAIDEFPIQDITESSYKEEEAMKWDIQNVSALWDYSRGATPSRKETATGIVRLQQAAQGRTEWILKKFDLYMLQPLARRIITFIREHMDPSEFSEIAGRDDDITTNEFYNLDPMTINRLLTVQPFTESIRSIREVEVNQFIQAYDRLIQLPEINRAGMAKALLLRLGLRNVKEFFPKLSGSAQDATVDALGKDQERADMKRALIAKAAEQGGPNV